MGSGGWGVEGDTGTDCMGERGGGGREGVIEGGGDTLITGAAVEKGTPVFHMGAPTGASTAWGPNAGGRTGITPVEATVRMGSIIWATCWGPVLYVIRGIPGGRTRSGSGSILIRVGVLVVWITVCEG